MLLISLQIASVQMLISLGNVSNPTAWPGGFVCVVFSVGVISVFDAVAFLACAHRVSSTGCQCTMMGASRGLAHDSSGFHCPNIGGCCGLGHLGYLGQVEQAHVASGWHLQQ